MYLSRIQRPFGVSRASPPVTRPIVLLQARGTAAASEPTSEARLKAIDDRLSNRPLQLDASGYFIIRVDREAREIIADHYSNSINEKGLAVDDDTGEVIGCRPGGAVRLPRRTFRGRTAKEISVRILEDKTDLEKAESQPQPHALPWISRLEHANYLGREFVRAELALLTGADYVQD